MTKAGYIGANCRARIAVEMAWGTAASGGTNIALAKESSLNLSGNDPETYEQMYAHTYPNKSGLIKIGHVVAPKWKTPIWPELKAIIAACVNRTDDELPSYTLEKVWATSGSTLPALKAAGCKCQNLTIISSASTKIVTADLSFIGKSIVEGTCAALLPTPTTEFLSKITTVSINSAALTGFDDVTLTFDITLTEGPRGSDGTVAYISEGFNKVTLDVKYPLAGKAYVTEFLSLLPADFAADVVFGNGISASPSTLTFAADHLKLMNDPLGNEDVETLQMYDLKFESFGTWTWAANE